MRASTLELLQKYQDSEAAERVLRLAADYLHNRYKVGLPDDWEAVDLLDHLRVVVRLDAKRMINTIGEQLNRDRFNDPRYLNREREITKVSRSIRRNVK